MNDSRLAQMEAALALAAHRFIVFCRDESGAVFPAIHCSDTFGWAVADCERIEWADCPALRADVANGGGYRACVEWVMERRGGSCQPIKPLESYATDAPSFDLDFGWPAKWNDCQRTSAAIALAEKDAEDVACVIAEDGRLSIYHWPDEDGPSRRLEWRDVWTPA